MVLLESGLRTPSFAQFNTRSDYWSEFHTSKQENPEYFGGKVQF